MNCFNYVSLWRRVLLGKLIVNQLVKKSPVFYGTLRFIIMFTEGRHWTLPRAMWIQSTQPRTVFKYCPLV